MHSFAERASVPGFCWAVIASLTAVPRGSGRPSKWSWPGTGCRRYGSCEGRKLAGASSTRSLSLRNAWLDGGRGALAAISMGWFLLSLRPAARRGRRGRTENWFLTWALEFERGQPGLHCRPPSALRSRCAPSGGRPSTSRTRVYPSPFG